MPFILAHKLRGPKQCDRFILAKSTHSLLCVRYKNQSKSSFSFSYLLAYKLNGFFLSSRLAKQIPEKKKPCITISRIKMQVVQQKYCFYPKCLIMIIQDAQFQFFSCEVQPLVVQSCLFLLSIIIFLLFVNGFA